MTTHTLATAATCRAAGEIGEDAVLGRTHLLTVPAMGPALLLRPVEDVR